ncbi:hypothetical protein [Nocardiopsis listeri]|uniref:hypothetical protein n=1 Tax=Nocardiopsis listeri TaxID=53440 RepID=UPI0008369DCB|nr:hypothetical protein [Nocardiopsis listeri]
MPSHQHEFPLDLIRNDPGSVVELLEEISGEPLPEHTRVRCDSTEATSTAPTHLTSDSVVVCERPPYPYEKRDAPVPVVGIIVELQNRPDRRKYCRWPAYVANTRLRPACPVVLLALSVAAPGALEKLIMLKDYEFKTELIGRPFREGRVEGRVDGPVEDLFGE